MKVAYSLSLMVLSIGVFSGCASLNADQKALAKKHLQPQGSTEFKPFVVTTEMAKAYVVAPVARHSNQNIRLNEMFTNRSHNRLPMYGYGRAPEQGRLGARSHFDEKNHDPAVQSFVKEAKAQNIELKGNIAHGYKSGPPIALTPEQLSKLKELQATVYINGAKEIGPHSSPPMGAKQITAFSVGLVATIALSRTLGFYADNLVHGFVPNYRENPTFSFQITPESGFSTVQKIDVGAFPLYQIEHEGYEAIEYRVLEAFPTQRGIIHHGEIITMLKPGATPEDRDNILAKAWMAGTGRTMTDEDIYLRRGNELRLRQHIKTGR